MTEECIKCTKNFKDSVEISCANLIFPADGNLLQNPNVLIGDTADTRHRSFSELQTINVTDVANKPASRQLMEE